MVKGKKLVHRSARKASGKKTTKVVKKHLKSKSSAYRKTQKIHKKIKRKTANKHIAKVREKLKVPAPVENAQDKLKVKAILENACFADFISKNVGKRAVDVINLISTPQTDEKVAAELNIKINEVRRILNVLDSYGVARYDTKKDNKGWLTFEWYLNAEKLTDLDNTIKNKKPDNAFKLQEDCNDFFYCSSCYKDQKVILPFDAAFEREFKCDNCGGKLKLLNRVEAASLFEQENIAQA